MADENTEGSRKRKSSSGVPEPTREDPQASEGGANASGETAGCESSEPSAKCQKTTTNLEIHPDTQTTQSAMKLNENAEGNGDTAVENPSGTEQTGRDVDATSSAQVDVEASLNVINNESDPQTPLSTHSRSATISNNNTRQAESDLTPESISTNNEENLEITPNTGEIPSQLETIPLNANRDDADTQNDENWDDCENDRRDTCGYPPVITITFSNKDSVAYKPAFLNFIQHFTDLDVVDLNNAIHLFKPDSPEVPNVPTGKANRNKKKKKAKKELFIVDAAPTTNEGQEMDKVKFSSKFKALEADEEEDVKAEVSSTGISMCFNCEGNHAIKNCPVPRDFAKIRLARQKFKNNAAKTGRYHVEEDQKFAHLKPGHISSKLREALGLGKYEVPAHVYKMRVLGYPPGWLEEAKIVHSNICMFDMEGKNVKDKASNKRKHIDPDKIVNYPGFNVEMERGSRDQGYHHGVPKYSQTHTKEAMVKFVNSMYITMEDNLETCDMDIDNSSDKEITEETTRTSPTLTDLEIKKKQLLEELVGNNSSSCETEVAPENAIEEVNNGEKNPEENNGHIVPMNQVKRSVIGTPILKSASPYVSLPKADNFMKDVSPVINFENLPNSTGKYEKMTGVLEKVRKTLKNIQEKT